MKLSLKVNDGRTYLTEKMRDTLSIPEDGHAELSAICNSKVVVIFNEGEHSLAILRDSLKNVQKEVNTLLKADGEGRVDAAKPDGAE